MIAVTTGLPSCQKLRTRSFVPLSHGHKAERAKSPFFHLLLSHHQFRRGRDFSSRTSSQAVLRWTPPAVCPLTLQGSDAKMAPAPIVTAIVLKASCLFWRQSPPMVISLVSLISPLSSKNLSSVSVNLVGTCLCLLLWHIAKDMDEEGENVWSCLALSGMSPCRSPTTTTTAATAAHAQQSGKSLQILTFWVAIETLLVDRTEAWLSVYKCDGTKRVRPKVGRLSRESQGPASLGLPVQHYFPLGSGAGTHGMRRVLGPFIKWE